MTSRPPARAEILRRRPDYSLENSLDSIASGPVALRMFYIWIGSRIRFLFPSALEREMAFDGLDPTPSLVKRVETKVRQSTHGRIRNSSSRKSRDKSSSADKPRRATRSSSRCMALSSCSRAIASPRRSPSAERFRQLLRSISTTDRSTRLMPDRCRNRAFRTDIQSGSNLSRGRFGHVNRPSRHEPGRNRRREGFALSHPDRGGLRMSR